MKIFTAIVEQCHDIGLYTGYVPGFPGAHTQAATLDELHKNLRAVIGMLINLLKDDIAIIPGLKQKMI